ncbi:hypothetical protein E5676_scaffold282G00100 [Cucumis melo var. makuwa]|uniref:Uncharacterized protein n=1 Tax=Cucumis melo var. makuwa TaxID=1194695 RepID=A0A5D3B788_CUCMM|nr:hypothetical protein E5676_scaffold282G00100 [Cucumis melo var. makuwa]
MAPILEGEVKEHKDESDSGKRPHIVNSTIKDVSTSKALVAKPVEQFLCASALLEEMSRQDESGGKTLRAIHPKEMSALKLRPEIAMVLSGIAKINVDDLTSLEEYLNSYLKCINVEFEQLSILSREKTKAIDQQEVEVVKLLNEVNTLESTSAITEEAIEALAMVRNSMKVVREEFKNFK